MKAFQVTIHLFNMNKAYTAAMVRNMVKQQMIGGPWNTESMTIAVEDLRDLPDLSSREPLGKEDLTALDGLREILTAQRDGANEILLRINARITATYPPKDNGESV